MDMHRLFKGTCGPLLAACALIAVLWAGSYRSITQVGLPVSVGGTRCECTSYRGLLSVALIENYPMNRPAAAVVHRDDANIAASWDEQFSSGAIGGFSVDDAQIWLTSPDGEVVARHFSALNLPYWLLLSLAALAPAHAAYLLVRAYRRTTHNQCGECGYELGDGEICQACAARAMIVGATSRMHPVR